jgi:3,4-dehydroadipyl-CoA semialdehyde dehydrogenase
MKLPNYVGGQWQAGSGDGEALVDPVLGNELARVSTEGIDKAAALDFGRRVGGSAMRALTYAERAALLGRIADVLTANRAAYYDIALANSGSPQSDAAIDIDGAIFTLKYFAKAGATLGAARYLRDSEMESLAKDGSFQALHIAVPLRGVAILINAFNFPAWGLWEKAAPALLSGVPVLAKPAASTSWLAQRMVDDVAAAGILPPGALSLLCGDPGDLLDHVTPADAVAFTGSAATGQRIRTHPAILRASTRLNVEADSLNCALLGPDASQGSAEFDLLVREVVKEMTVKAGQKCTAIRRILVPTALRGAVAEAITARLADVAVGNPRNPAVRMGPLVNRRQQAAAWDGIARLRREASLIFGGQQDFAPIDADAARAAFVPPTLLTCENPFAAPAVHEVEVFGPVATVVPYADAEQAFALARLGQGSLVASVFSADDDFATRAALELADSHGRVLCVDASVAKTQTGHGNAMPQCLHGGPGRAGGGEELGGLRAQAFYHQRCAVQGGPARLAALTAQSWSTCR